MRKIMSILSDIRQEQLISAKEKGLNISDAKFKEARDFFSTADNVLSGIKSNDAGNELREVMTTGDFTYAIGEFVQRLVIPGYNRKVFNFEAFVKPEKTPNLLPVTRYQRRAGVDDLEYVGEKGQTRPGSVDDATKRQFQVYRWEKQYDFSMEALINDDLGYLENTAPAYGEAARRSLEKFVSRMMWNAVTQARLLALGALYMTTGRLSTARISVARMAFNQRVDARGEPITAKLDYLVYHPGLADTVAQIQNSTLVPELATNGVNVVKGTFTPIEDPYCPGVAPNLPWFAMTSYQTTGIVPFILARWEGQAGPRLWRKKSDMEPVGSLLGAAGASNPLMGDFHTRDIEFVIQDMWGTYIDTVTDGNMFDTNGCYTSTGTAP